MDKNLENLLNPESVAIIGASTSFEKVGSIVLKNIVSSYFLGKVYPVNPNTQEIYGLKSYPKVADLPEIVDLAIVAVPAAIVSSILKEIGEKGIKNVVIFSAGYKEIGAEGKVLEDELIKISEQYNLNILGPNCLGFVNKLTPINATFGQPVREKGKLRFISQSGALAASLFDFFNAIGIGFSEFVTLGNKAVINENDILEYFKQQDKKKPDPEDPFPTGMYLESISNGYGFFKLLKDLSKKNPIFIIKPGKSPAACRAMQSHTGSIAGEDNVLNTALNQAGVIRCETLEDFFDLSRAFSWEKAPLGPKVAVVSNAGGPCVISADAASCEGLELAEFDAETTRRLQEHLPRFASALNPVDVLGDALADRIAKACETILEKNQAQSLVVILTPQVMTQIEKTAELIGALGKKYHIPIFCSFIGGTLVAEGERKLNEFKIPSFRYPERALRTIAMMWKWKSWQQQHASDESQIQNQQITDENKNKIKEILQNVTNQKREHLDNFESNDILSLTGITTPPTQKITSLEEAKNFAACNLWPVVLKLSSPGLLHKADVGGIIKNIEDENELALGLTNLEQTVGKLEEKFRSNTAKQIQKQITGGVEVIVGIKKDPNFGPVLLFGAGGTMAELIMDRNLHLLPINLNSAKEIVEKSKIFKILNGYRGQPKMALDKLYDAIVKLASLAEISQIKEIEINPLIVTVDNVSAVDGKTLIFCDIVKSTMSPNFHTATAVGCKNIAGKYYSFSFETDQPFSSKPGQYVSVKVADTRINSYSIADQESPAQFSLLVDTTPGGPGSKYFEALQPGDKISFLGPFGTFGFKPDDGANRLLFLGTGSGCAPLRYIIDDLLKVKKAQTPIALYLGLRFVTDVFWKDYFENLEKEYPNFKFNLCLSKPEATWQGKSGHITDFVSQDFPDASGASAYLCGNKIMVDEVSNVLQSHGCKKERIYFEKF